MKIIKASKIVGLIAAGKIACSTQIAVGKGGEDEDDFSLNLSEKSYVTGAFVEPNDGNGEEGTLCAEAADGARVDFLIDGVLNDVQKDIYLVISPKLGDVISAGNGDFQLDIPSLEIMAAITVAPGYSILRGPDDTSIGSAKLGTHAAIPITFYWSDMSSSSLSDDQFFVQAVAFPSGTIDFSRAQVSEVDTFTIDRTASCSGDSGKDGGDGGGDDGSGDDGGK